MINEVSAVTFRKNLGEMLNQVQYRHDVHTGLKLTPHYG